MPDWFVMFTPLLLLPIVALLRFVGCDQLLNLRPTTPAHMLAVSPMEVQLFRGQSLKFTATLDGTVTAQVNWSVLSGSATPGQITSDGTYTAPANVSDGFSEQVVAAGTFGSDQLTATATVKILPGNSAVFVRFDDLTQGSWQGVYGGGGFALAHLPQPDTSPSVPILNFPTQIFKWEDPSVLVKSLEGPPPGTGRYAYTWYDPNGQAIAFIFNLPTDKASQVAVYCVDWDTPANQPGRQQTITMLDAASSATLATQSIASFQNGVYLVWNLSGQVRMEATLGAGASVVVSGIFFG